MSLVQTLGQHSKTNQPTRIADQDARCISGCQYLEEQNSDFRACKPHSLHLLVVLLWLLMITFNLMLFNLTEK